MRLGSVAALTLACVLLAGCGSPQSAAPAHAIKELTTAQLSSCLEAEGWVGAPPGHKAPLNALAAQLVRLRSTPEFSAVRASINKLPRAQISPHLLDSGGTIAQALANGVKGPEERELTALAFSCYPLIRAAATSKNP